MKTLLPLLGLLAASAVWAQPQWRLSDASGADRGPAPGGSSTPGWVLLTDPGDPGAGRTLYQDGLPVKKAVGGADPGLPLLETYYENGSPSETSVLEYRDGSLTSRAVSDPSGNPLYRDILRRWPDGRLRRLEREDSSGSLTAAAWSYGPGGTLTGAWSTGPAQDGLTREWVFGPGRTEETRSAGGETVLTRVTETLPAGTSVEILTEPKTGRVVRRTLDSGGRALEETETLKESVVRSRSWAYDGQGRVTEAVTETGGLRELWSYAYQGDGSVEARLTRAGVAVREEVTRDGELLRSRLFDRGELFLVETWVDGKKAKQEFYRKGVLVRERTP